MNEPNSPMPTSTNKNTTSKSLSQEQTECSSTAEYYDCIIVGAGAAGLMCAAQAAARGRRVLVLERSKKPGRKILMSGGGRCNFTNLSVAPEQFVSNNPHFCISALRRYTSADFIALVESYDLAYHEKTLGQLFCDHKSKDILNILLAECERYGASILTQCSVESVEPLSLDESIEHDSTSARFRLLTSKGAYCCHSLVVATGGLSIPSMGATGFGYELAQQFGLSVTECQPSLVPLLVPKRYLSRVQELSGLSLKAQASCQGMQFENDLLFTHKGLSGPVILQISNYWHYGQSITLDFLPMVDIKEQIKLWVRQGERAVLHNLLGQLLPKRFVSEWLLCEPSLKSVAKARVQELSGEVIHSLSKALHECIMTPAGTQGYTVAEVTRGGVDTAGVSSKTFEAHQCAGLYFIGEVLDVTGWLGGYNFQWAWASGYCAGQVV